MIRRNSKSSGVLLLEIAIGVSIISIISGFFITKYIIANKAMRILKTKTNIEFVISSIAAYLANNGRLPRPALDDNGVESENHALAIGKLPYNSLGISVKNAMDGDARIFTYIVEPALTTCQSIYESAETTSIMDSRDDCFCKNIVKPKIEIKGQSNSHIDDVIVFAIDTADMARVVSDSDGKIIVNPSPNTFWIRRNVFLVQYLKSRPREKTYSITTHLKDEFDDTTNYQQVTRNDDLF